MMTVLDLSQNSLDNHHETSLLSSAGLRKWSDMARRLACGADTQVFIDGQEWFKKKNSGLLIMVSYLIVNNGLRQGEKCL